MDPPLFVVRVVQHLANSGLSTVCLSRILMSRILHFCILSRIFLSRIFMSRTFAAPIHHLHLLPRCMQCRRGLAMRILSVRLSVKRVICDKMEEISVQIFISYERSFSLVF